MQVSPHTARAFQRPVIKLIRPPRFPFPRRVHCKAFTLLLFSSRVALAIRLCSRVTNCSTVGQTMLSQSVTAAEGASVNSHFIAETFIAVICVASFTRFSKFSYQRRPVRSGHTFVLRQSLYPPHYTMAFAFSDVLFQHRDRIISRLFIFIPEARYWVVTFRWTEYARLGACC